MPVLNYMKDAKDERDYLFDNTEILGEFANELHTKHRLQASSIVDYRPYMSSVKDQGGLGSCVGFAVTALKEFHENVEYLLEREEGSDYIREIEEYDLSEQWVYWKTKTIDPWGPAVEGTSIRYALKVLQKIGCPPEKAWRYVDNTIDIGKPESWSHLVARWNTIESYWRLSTLDDIILSLRDVGPVLLGVGCYEEIFSPEADGFVPYPSQPQYCYGGHAILACGYNAETERVLFKNSWSEGWGDGGYGWLGYDYLRSFCWDAWVTKDHNVTKAMLKGKVTL